MDPVFQGQWIIWLFAGAAIGVHWFFMRGYERDRKKQGDLES